MQYTIFKLNFKTAVHFGSGRLSKSEKTFYADTLFSALYSEAIKLFGTEKADELRLSAEKGELLISDAMPFYNDKLYLPKPIIHIDTQRESDSSLKKQFKKLKYIPADELKKFVTGDFLPTNELEDMGYSEISAKVAVIPGEDNLPYNVGTFSFEKGYGLYFICGGSDDAVNMVYDIMDSLKYAGIGGKISSGYGKFEYTHEDLPEYMLKAVEGDHSGYMSLSVSMGRDISETEKALDGGYTELIKRSGFVGSPDYADGFMKKRDFFCFRGGSCFKNRFDGIVADVSDGGNHPVYRYAIPFFYGFDREG